MRFEYGRVTFESMSCGEEDGNCLIVPEAVNGGSRGHTIAPSIYPIWKVIRMGSCDRPVSLLPLLRSIDYHTFKLRGRRKPLAIISNLIISFNLIRQLSGAYLRLMLYIRDKVALWPTAVRPKLPHRPSTSAMPHGRGVYMVSNFLYPTP